MATDFVMPKLAMAMNEGTLNEWLVADGGYINKGELIADIETEKTTYEVEAPESGYLHILLEPGVTVDCGTIMAQFAADEDELASLRAAMSANDASTTEVLSVSSVPTPTVHETSVQATWKGATQAENRGKSGRRNVSPLARKMAKDRGLALELITGTGPRGRIVKRDVVAAVQQGLAATQDSVGTRIKGRVPFKGARKTIAARMMQSLQSSAQLSSFWESDITDLMAVRTRFVEREAQFGTRVSINAFLAKAMVYAIRQIPIANGALDGDDILIYDNVNLGFAVSMAGHNEYDSSLVVPVLKNIEHLGVVEIDQRLKALVTAVREGKATESDFNDSTITLSSTAGIAPPGHSSTPVLNMPNAVLVGPSTPCEKPAVVNGKILPRTLLPINVTFDHRILDGDPAVRFMAALHEALEHPELMLA